jgi:hypothetical protein
MRLRRILEYLNREDAERAVKDLSGRDLRGQAVRVDLHDDVSTFSVYLGEVRITRWPAQP